jgi:hypothetical protein
MFNSILCFLLQSQRLYQPRKRLEGKRKELIAQMRRKKQNVYKT